jgi:ABC-type nickel/cobalt efflux system permease component RcnA
VAEDQKQPIFRSWSPDDSKLLAITFVATVAANLVTVLFVGLAIALSHGINQRKANFWTYGLLIVAIAISVLGPAIAFVAVRDIGKRRTDTPDAKWIGTSLAVSRIALIVLGLFMACIGALYALTLIGLAAGVR